MIQELLQEKCDETIETILSIIDTFFKDKDKISISYNHKDYKYTFTLEDNRFVICTDQSNSELSEETAQALGQAKLFEFVLSALNAFALTTDNISSPDTIKELIKHKYRMVKWKYNTKTGMSATKTITVLNNLKPEHLQIDASECSKEELFDLIDAILDSNKYYITPQIRGLIYRVVIRKLGMICKVENEGNEIVNDELVGEYVEYDDKREFSRLNLLMRFLKSIPIACFTYQKHEESVDELLEKSGFKVEKVNDLEKEYSIGMYILHVLDNRDLFDMLFHHALNHCQDIPFTYFPSYFEDYIYNGHNLFEILSFNGVLKELDDKLFSDKNELVETN